MDAKGSVHQDTNISSMTTPYKLLISGCQICQKSNGLNTCGKCKVVQYCGREHQANDWPAHKVVCKDIGRARMELEAEQAETAAMDALAGQFAATLPGGTDIDALLKLAMLDLRVIMQVFHYFREKQNYATSN
jgi:hypothetical protein